MKNNSNLKSIMKIKFKSNATAVQNKYGMGKCTLIKISPGKIIKHFPQLLQSILAILIFYAHMKMINTSYTSRNAMVIVLLRQGLARPINFWMLIKSKLSYLILGQSRKL